MIKLFGSNRKKEADTLQITRADRLWVNDSFKVLLQVFGYPGNNRTPILFTAQYFPETFSAGHTGLECLTRDLCHLMQIEAGKITVEVIDDMHSIYGMPYGTEGNPFEAYLEINDGNYKIYVANSVQKRPGRLLSALVCQFTGIRLTEHKLIYDHSEGQDQFLYLAGIYFGFGTILAQNLTAIDRTDDGFWEQTWNYISEIPAAVMAYALALYAKLAEPDSQEWKDYLPAEINRHIEKAIRYVEENPAPVFDKEETEACLLFKSAHDHYLENKFEAGIADLLRILTLTKDEIMKANALHNLGYYHLRLQQYGQGLSYLKQSIGINPGQAYVNDNIGYALIKMGELEAGKESVMKSIAAQNNDLAYSYRNLALYHQAKGEMALAEDFFKQAFESISDNVDLLEYYYGEFLLQNSQTGNGLDFLKKAVAKGEPEAIKRLNELMKL